MPSKHSVKKRAAARGKIANCRMPAVIPHLEPWITEAFQVIFCDSDKLLISDHVAALAMELLMTRALRCVTGANDGLWRSIEAVTK